MVHQYICGDGVVTPTGHLLPCALPHRLLEIGLFIVHCGNRVPVIEGRDLAICWTSHPSDWQKEAVEHCVEIKRH